MSRFLGGGLIFRVGRGGGKMDGEGEKWGLGGGRCGGRIDRWIGLGSYCSSDAL